MTISDSTRNKLLELLSELRSERSRIEKNFHLEVDKIDNDLASVQRTLDLLTGETNIVADSSAQLELYAADTSIIANARTQSEAIEMMAKHNQGVVNVTRAADFLIRAGRAKGRRRNLIGTIYNMLSSNDKWAWASPGTFRLRQQHGITIVDTHQNGIEIVNNTMDSA